VYRYIVFNSDRPFCSAVTKLRTLGQYRRTFVRTLGFARDIRDRARTDLIFALSGGASTRATTGPRYYRNELGGPYRANTFRAFDKKTPPVWRLSYATRFASAATEIKPDANFGITARRTRLECPTTARTFENDKSIVRGPITDKRVFRTNRAKQPSITANVPSVYARTPKRITQLTKPRHSVGWRNFPTGKCRKRITYNEPRTRALHANERFVLGQFFSNGHNVQRRKTVSSPRIYIYNIHTARELYERDE